MRVRVRQPVALYDQAAGTHRVPRADEYFDDDDPLVVAHRWAFASDQELEAAASADAVPVESVRVEDASKNPGSRRDTRRPR